MDAIIHEVTYYYVLMFQIIRVLVDFYYTHMCFDFLLIFSFSRVLQSLFCLWRHTQFHLTVFSSVFLSCAVQFVQ